MLSRINKKFILLAIGVVILLVATFSFLIFWYFHVRGVSTNQITSNATSSSKPAATTTPTPSVKSPNQPISDQPVFVGTPAEISWGNRNKKQVIFTFDGGSGSQSAQVILTTLGKYNVKGTFFLTGTWVNQNQDLTRQLSQKGYEIFNHTTTHPHFTQISDTQIISELKGLNDIVYNLTGRSTKPYFRPPYGERNAHVLDVAASQGYQSVYWTIDALDWKESTGTTAQQVHDRIMTNLKPGTIYLMHIGDNITGQILDNVFNEIKAQGYTIVSLTEGIK